jgi:hypothetical protein
MSDEGELRIRSVEITDLKKLGSFFVKAYGPDTAFQDPNFLLYFFNSGFTNGAPLSANLIGLNDDEEIVSHYGGLSYKLRLGQEIIGVVWGVNAFTLPEYRGNGLNSQIVNILHERNESNAVIGMPFNAPFFYEKFGYNIFQKRTLSRYVLALNEEIYSVVHQLGQNGILAKHLIPVNKLKSQRSDNTRSIVRLTKSNIGYYSLDMDEDLLVTTHRDLDFLNWRVFENPYIAYNVYGYVIESRVVAYIVLREEILHPFGLLVNRIIDLYGKHDGIIPLLEFVINESSQKGHIYLDFSAFGNIYDVELNAARFVKLAGEDCCLLPQVTSPIENRPNHEFIVIQSKNYKSKIEGLSENSVYFTRIDGDRDRIARMSQINNNI